MRLCLARLLIGAVAAACAGSVHAQLVDENLLVAVPDGYKTDYRARNSRELISEMVPRTESVNDWNDMVTVQIFYGLNVSVQGFRARSQQGWAKACAGSTFQDVTSGDENGYPVMVWLQSCPRNPQTGRPEYTWFKAIAGRDSFYVVQKAFKSMPDNNQIGVWMRYLHAVSVCDSRVPARACPTTKN